MSDKPASEVTIDERLLRATLSSQAAHLGDAASGPLRRVAEGWDCEIWRWGAGLGVRVPRRASAAPLIAHEHQALPVLGPRLASVGLRTPMPLLAGEPDEHFPWPWSVVAWIEGSSGLVVPRELRAGWAEPLARALRMLHSPAPSDAPGNPFRGVPLSARASAVSERWQTLAGQPDNRRAIDAPLLYSAVDRWERAREAPAWDAAPVWIHGDLHAGNLVARGSQLRGLIDFGDVTFGDPAYDLAVAWVVFDPLGRDRFRAALDRHYDDATWERAHGWAAAIAFLLLTHSDDDPIALAAGRDALVAVTERDRA